MLESMIKKGFSFEKKTDQMLAMDKHLIPFAGAYKHNNNFVIRGKPQGGTLQFETYVATHSCQKAPAYDDGHASHNEYSQGQFRAHTASGIKGDRVKKSQ